MMEKISHMTAEQAREFRSQISEMSGKKQDGFDPITMFKMLNDTREAGMNFGLKINDLAKQIAEADIQPAQPKGLVESVLDNLGKFAPLMLAAQQNTSPAAHFAQQPQAIAQAPAKLVPVPPAPTYKKPVETKATVAQPVAQPRVVQANPATKPVVKKTTTKSVVASNAEAGKINGDAELKAKVIEICVPLIGHALQNSINSGGLGDATINAFNAQGINPKLAVSLVGVEDIYDLAFKQYSLPDVPELRHYLKDYHDYITEKASIGESGQVARSTN
jgi:hypothetical protein